MCSTSGYGGMRNDGDVAPAVDMRSAGAFQRGTERRDETKPFVPPSVYLVRSATTTSPGSPSSGSCQDGGGCTGAPSRQGHADRIFASAQDLVAIFGGNFNFSRIGAYVCLVDAAKTSCFNSLAVSPCHLLVRFSVAIHLTRIHGRTRGEHY